jgi:dTDP-4-amino-4,6-dideoxygalactose transaminase
MTPQIATEISLFQMDRKLSKHRADIDAAISEVLKSNSFVLGEKLIEFEESFAEYIGVTYTVGVANGTDAIELCIRSLDLSPGSTIATVANASNYATTAIQAAGHIPLFMDIDSKTQLTNLDNVIEALNLGANAIVLTHLYGSIVSEISEIVTYCKEREIPMIEDCAQAHGATLQGRKAGSFGDVSSFSFYPTKNLGALGDAGLVASNNAELIERLKKLRNYGWSNKYKIEFPGGRNSRMDELQAAILSRLLPHLDEENSKRDTYVGRILKEVRNQSLSFLNTDGRSSWHLLVVLSNKRDELIEYLGKCGIQTGLHYPILDNFQIGRQNFQKCYDLVNSIDSAGKILTLPMSPYLTDDEVTHLINSLNNFNPEI